MTMKTCSKGWSKRCADAKRMKCTCRCGGENHGKLNQLTIFDIILEHPSNITLPVI